LATEGANATFVGAAGVVHSPNDLALGPVLTISSATGLSEHLAGGGGTLDLNSIDVAIAGHPGLVTLYLVLSETGFGPIGAGNLQLSIGGTLASLTSLDAWGKKDPDNRLWGGLTVPSTVPPGPGVLSGNFTGHLGSFVNASPSDMGFSGDTSVAHTALAGYSLTEEVRILFGPSTSTQTVSFDFHLHNPITPEPTNMALAGIGALGFLVYGLRRRRTRGA
jgi:hypothetical protein